MSSSDGGLGYALGRRQDASRELESTVFWLTAAIGASLAAACALAALPMGAIMRQPRLPLLIVALSPILLMNGLTAVSNGRIIREGRFGTFAAGDLLSTAAGGRDGAGRRPARLGRVEPCRPAAGAVERASSSG